MTRSIAMLSANTWRDLPAIVYGMLTGNLSSRREHHVRRYESAFEAFMEGGHVISFGAARMALSALLEVFDVGPGDEVILPGYTCVVVPNSILFRGARPVYVDIDARSCNMVPDKIEAAITPRTKVIFAQHSFGVACNLDAILEIARRHNLKVIEDCAPAVGARYRGKLVGTFGDAAIFSSEKTKVISTGMGGVAYTRDAKTAEAVRRVQAKASWPRYKRAQQDMVYLLSLVLLQSPRTFHFELPQYYLKRLGLVAMTEMRPSEMVCSEPDSYMQRLSGGQARVGLSQLRQLERNLAHRRALAAFYRQSLEEMGMPVDLEGLDDNPAYARFPFRVKDKYGLATRLKEKNIYLGLWFTAPIHPASVDPELAQYEQGQCPVAEQVCDHVANLPTHPRMSFQDAQVLMQALKQAVKEQELHEVS